MSLEPLISASPQIQIHVAGALIALLVGPLAIWRKRRDRWHRYAGYVFVVAMIAAIAASFFIFSARIIGPFSPIHILSVLAAVSLWQGWRHIRARRIKAHEVTMKGLYFQALGLAGIFTFLPGRRMNRMFFPENEILGAAVVITIGMAAFGWFVVRPALLARFTPSLRKTERL